MFFFFLEFGQAFCVYLSKKVHRQKPKQFNNLEVKSPLLAFSSCNPDLSSLFQV